jgi:hypothetical protein
VVQQSSSQRVTRPSAAPSRNQRSHWPQLFLISGMPRDLPQGLSIWMLRIQCFFLSPPTTLVILTLTTPVRRLQRPCCQETILRSAGSEPMLRTLGSRQQLVLVIFFLLALSFHPFPISNLSLLLVMSPREDPSLFKELWSRLRNPPRFCWFWRGECFSPFSSDPSGSLLLFASPREILPRSLSKSLHGAVYSLAAITISCCAQRVAARVARRAAAVLTLLSTKALHH